MSDVLDEVICQMVMDACNEIDDIMFCKSIIRLMAFLRQHNTTEVKVAVTKALLALIILYRQSELTDVDDQHYVADLMQQTISPLHI